MLKIALMFVCILLIVYTNPSGIQRTHNLNKDCR